MNVGVRRWSSNYDETAMHGNPPEPLQLWLATPDAAQHFDPSQLAEDERERMARLRRAARRQEFAVSRALRAHVQRGAREPASQSLSHSSGHAALARAAPELRVGVDLEVHRSRDALTIARTAFSESEARALEAATSPERERLFYVMWTVKEALAKALRLELLDALRCCEIVVNGSAGHARLATPVAGWVAVYQPRAELTLAVACIAPTSASFIAPTSASSFARAAPADSLDAALPVETWSWPPQRPASWPLMAAISLSGAGAPAAADCESAGAARAAAPTTGSGTAESSCGCVPAHPRAIS